MKMRKKRVDFIALAGEVCNSDSSSPAYMEEVWHKAKELQMNTLLLPVSWELVEPEEGIFDFSIPDALLEQARAQEMKIVFLWFGSWKNAQCYYAPGWVKRDTVRFPRAQVKKGENKIYLENLHDMPYTSLSCFGEATKKADARAFAEFMRHLKIRDEEEKTVIMVQVENETGVQGAAREHSDLADEIFAGNVPEEFADYMRDCTGEMAEDVRRCVEAGKKGHTWSETFGDVAEEIFSAYHIASFVNTVAAAGKEVYDIPMSVNCWLDKKEKAGMYPSGGPVARMMEVWKYAAPAIDVFCPDIYVPDFCGVCDEYGKMGNPLFVPETATHSHAGSRLVYAVGHYHAWGYSPFAFEHMGQPFNASQSFLFGVDVNDPLLSVPQNVEEYAWYNRTLSSMMPLLTERYDTDRLQAVISERPEENVMHFDDFGFQADLNPVTVRRKDSVCLVLQESGDTFYILMNACMLIPFSRCPEKKNVDILLLEEGEFTNEGWIAGRRLNGDEAARLISEEPVLWRIKLLMYE